MPDPFPHLPSQAQIDRDHRIESVLEFARDLFGAIGLAGCLLAGLFLVAGFGGF